MTSHFLFQELNVKLTKLGKQLQANQIMLHEIKATLQQNGLAKSHTSQVDRRELRSIE